MYTKFKSCTAINIIIVQIRLVARKVTRVRIAHERIGKRVKTSKEALYLYTYTPT